MHYHKKILQSLKTTDFGFAYSQYVEAFVPQEIILKKLLLISSLKSELLSLGKLAEEYFIDRYKDSDGGRILI